MTFIPVDIYLAISSSTNHTAFPAASSLSSAVPPDLRLSFFKHFLSVLYCTLRQSNVLRLLDPQTSPLQGRAWDQLSYTTICPTASVVLAIVCLSRSLHSCYIR